MRPLATLLLVTAWIAMIGPARADDGGLLKSFLEKRLSQAGRTVTLSGFEGALNSTARLDKLTIADDQGIWLTIEDAELNWSRTALLTGRLQVNKLTAARIDMPRKPGPQSRVPSAKAEPFSLPDLPVSIEIGDVSVGELTLGAPVLGKAQKLELKANAQLNDEGLSADIVATEALNGGRLTLATSYGRDTRILDLDLVFREPKAGILATLLKIPGQAALDLRVAGDGPLDDFKADLSLAADDAQVLAGALVLSQSLDGTMQASADLGGDIRPLVAARFSPFFGDRVSLSFALARDQGGALDIPSFRLETGALQADGRLAVTADGKPGPFQLSARLGATDGPIPLPVSGPLTTLSAADLSAQYDPAVSDQWTATLSVAELARDGLGLESTRADLQGVLEPDAITGQLRASISGLTHRDPAMAQAIGSAIDLRTAFRQSGGAPFMFEDLTLTSGNVRLIADILLRGLEGGLQISGSAQTSLDDLSRFAALAGRPIAGAAELDLIGYYSPIDGAFSLDVGGGGNGLKVGQTHIDRLIGGQSRVLARARRDATGTYLSPLNLTSDIATLSGTGTSDGETAAFTLSANIPDGSRLDRGLSGPLRAGLELSWRKDSPVQLNALRVTGSGIDLAGAAAFDPEAATAPLAGKLRARIDDLSVFSNFVNRRLNGALSLDLSGEYATKGQQFSVLADLTGRDLSFAIAQLDELLKGDSTVALDAAGGWPDVTLNAARFDGNAISLKAQGDAENGYRFDTDLRNIARLVPGVSGDTNLSGTMRLVDDQWDVDARLAGPGQAALTLAGRVASDFSNTNSTLTGRIPLALANGVLQPRALNGDLALDLALNGRPGLAAVSGTLSASGARFADPSTGIALEDIALRTDLAGETANLSLNARSARGGTAALTGNLGLGPRLPADLALTFNRFALSDGRLYETDVSGALDFSGDLATSGRLRGGLTLGQTEIRVPKGFASSGAAGFDVVHRNEPAKVARTRDRAGIGGEPSDTTSAGPDHRLDLRIDAPGRIFVRGQGIDAELGGTLRLGGTTQNIAPTGRFELIRGRLDILTKRLTLTEGYGVLQGSFDPFLRLVAETTSDDETVAVIAEGRPSDLRLSFSSSSGLPEEEVVARLLLGKGLGAISPFQAAQLAAVLAGGGNASVSDRLRRQFGLDDLDVTSSDDGGTQLRFGKYLSDNVYSDVTIGENGKSRVNLNLDISKNATVRGSVGADGNTGIGLFFERDY